MSSRRENQASRGVERLQIEVDRLRTQLDETALKLTSAVSIFGTFKALVAAPQRLILINPKTGKPMTNFEAKNDTNYAIPIKAANAVGQSAANIAGDTYTVASSVLGLFSIGTLKDGVSPALLIGSAGFGLTSGAMATVTDADGLIAAVLVVDVVADLDPTAIVLDVADAEATLGTNAQASTTAAPSGVSPTTGQPVPAPAPPTAGSGTTTQPPGTSPVAPPVGSDPNAPAPVEPTSPAAPVTAAAPPASAPIVGA